jgi:two-component sensor histidine kinase
MLLYIQYAFKYIMSLDGEMPPDEIVMDSRLSLIPAMVAQLRFDPELRSRIEGREAEFCAAVSEALANAVTHGNHNDPSRMVHVRCTFEPAAVQIAMRDEGAGFDPEQTGRGKPLYG